MTFRNRTTDDRLRTTEWSAVRGPWSVARGFAALTATVTFAGSAGAQQRIPTPPHIGNIIIDQFMDLIWRPETNYFKSPGPVRIILEDPKTGEKTVVLADDAEGQANGDIIVHGAARVERTEGTLSGEGLTYHANTMTGSVLHARIDANGIRLRGDRIDLQPGRVLVARGAYLTTCIKQNPDYHITAKEVRVTPDRVVRAKNVTFYLGKVRIISLPSLRKSFRHASSSPVPLPGYSSSSGLRFHFHNESIAEPEELLDYSAAFATKTPPELMFDYERDLGRATPDMPPPRLHSTLAAPPRQSALEALPPPTLRSSTDTPPPAKRYTMYAMTTANTFVFNRVRTDLQVSRLPEVGVHFANVLGAAIPDTGEPLTGPRTLFRPRDWLLNFDVGAGYYQERPTHAHAARVSLRGDATSPFIPLAGALHFRYGGTAWANAYSGGRSYALLAPEAELDYLFGRTHLVSAAYRYEQAFGTTPFAFDSLDIRQEARLGYGYLGTRWAYNFGVNFDIQRRKAYDTTVSIRRRLDCLEFGVGYRARGSVVSLILNLLPPKGVE